MICQHLSSLFNICHDVSFIDCLIYIIFSPGLSWLLWVLVSTLRAFWDCAVSEVNYIICLIDCIWFVLYYAICLIFVIWTDYAFVFLFRQFWQIWVWLLRMTNKPLYPSTTASYVLHASKGATVKTHAAIDDFASGSQPRIARADHPRSSYHISASLLRARPAVVNCDAAGDSPTSR